MEAASLGSAAIGGHSEVEKPFKQENKDFFLSPSTEFAPPPVTMRADSSTVDDAKDNTVALVTDLNNSGGISSNATLESSFSALGKPEISQMATFEQNVSRQMDGSQHVNGTEQHNDDSNDMVVVKDDVVTSAFPFDRVSEGMPEVLPAATMEREVTNMTTVNITEASLQARETSVLEPDIKTVAVNLVANAQEQDTIMLAGELVEEQSLVEEQIDVPHISGPDVAPQAETSSIELPLVNEQAVVFTNVQEQEGQEKQKMSFARSRDVSEKDIKAIKGQKVQKKFGKKHYLGDVIGYDPETKWFRVAYEDGDVEDLEVWEVKLILASAASQPSGSNKQARSDGGKVEEAKRSTKKTKKSPRKSTPKKHQGSAKNTLSKASKSLKSKGKSPKKTTAGKKSKDSWKSIMTSPKTPTLKRKGNAEPKGQRGTPKHRRGVPKSEGLAEAFPLDLVSPGNSSGKAMKLPIKRGNMTDTSKSKRAVRKRKADTEIQSEVKRKRSRKGKEEGSSPAVKSDNPPYIGRPVRKEFGGTFFEGAVVKFDKKTNFYKVKYEDGDQEDLELTELEGILVPRQSDIDTDTTPTKLSSLSFVMSRENARK